MSILIIVLIFAVSIYLIATTTSREFKRACRLFDEGGHDDEVKTILEEIYLKHEEAPAKLASLYLSKAWKNPSKSRTALKTALGLPTAGLSIEAKSSLLSKQAQVISFIAEQADKNYHNKNYHEAVLFIELIEKKSEYQNTAKKYHARYLSLDAGKAKVLKQLLKDDDTGIVDQEIFSAAGDFFANRKYQESLNLLELLRRDDKVSELIDRNVIDNLENNSTLLECTSNLKSRVLKTAEAYIDTLSSSPERQIVLYRLIRDREPGQGISEKIARASFNAAVLALKRSDYGSFQKSFNNLLGNDSLEKNAKNKLIHDFRKEQFNFFADCFRKGTFKSEWRVQLDTNIENYSREERHSELVSIVKLLSDQKKYAESNNICIQLDQKNEEIKSLVIKNSLALLSGSGEYISLLHIYPNSSLISDVANEIFKQAKGLSQKGDKNKAMYYCNLAEQYVTERVPFYEFVARLSVEITKTCKTEETYNNVAYTVAVLKKKECKSVKDECVNALQKAAESLADKNYKKCYLICEQLTNENDVFSELFIDSAYEKCKNKQEVDIKKVKKEIEKKDDQYPDFARFVKYIPDFKADYIKWTGKFITKLKNDGEGKVLEFFDSIEENQTKADLLAEASRLDSSVFETLSLHLLSDPRRYLDSKSVLLATLSSLLVSHNNKLFASTCLRGLFLAGYDVKEQYVSVVLSRANEESDQLQKLAIIDDGLEACMHARLLEAKRGIASQLSSTDPLTSIRICGELEKYNVKVNDILLNSYIARCSQSSDIKEKDKYLTLSKKMINESLAARATSSWKGWSLCSDSDDWSKDLKLSKEGELHVGRVILRKQENWKLRKACSWDVNYGSNNGRTSKDCICVQDGQNFVVNQTGLYEIALEPNSGHLYVILIESYFNLEKNALDLFDAYTKLGDTEKAQASLTGLPSLQCERKALSLFIKEAKKISGETAAIEYINNVISKVEENYFFGDQDYQESFSKLLDELASRYIKKAEKQPRKKAIESLTELQKRLSEYMCTSLHCVSSVENVLGPLCFDEGIELEEKGDLQKAQGMYNMAIKNGQAEKAVGRHAICSVKREDLTLKAVTTEVEKVKETLPSDLKKDLLYRYVLRLLKAGEINAAEEIAKTSLRSKKLADLCESCKLKKVKSLMLDFNRKVEAITDGSLGYADATAFISSIPELAKPILSVYPEHSAYFASCPEKLKPYLIKAAYKSGDFRMVYDNLRKVKKDFVSDLTLFRNLAVSCLGLIENNGLNDRNYEDVISIWLSAVFCDALIVKSLDYTSWDDGYTFCLDDSLSQTYHYDNLPDNINFDEPSDKNISIGSVQKSLLERTEGVLASLKQEYYDFYLKQKAAMAALVDLFGAETGNAIAPHTISLLPSSYGYELKRRLINDAYDKEGGLKVGFLYGFRDDNFSSYHEASECVESCIDSARTLKYVETSFSAYPLSCIRKFSGLYSEMLSEVKSVVLNHTTSGRDFKTLIDPLCTIAKALSERELSHTVGEFLNGEIAQAVKGGSMTQTEALPLLVKSYLGCQTHSGLKQNSEVVLGNTIGEFIRKGHTADKNAIIDVIETTRYYDSHIIDVISDFGVETTLQKNRAISILDSLAVKAIGKSSDIARAKDSINVMSQVASILEGAKNGTSNLANDLKTMYDLYKTHKDHEIVCVVLAQIASACISVYFFNGQAGGYGVETILNQLLSNRSSKFLEQTHYFRDNLNDMRSKLGRNYYQLLSLSDYELNDNGRRLKKALNFLDNFCS